MTRKVDKLLGDVQQWAARVAERRAEQMGAHEGGPRPGTGEDDGAHRVPAPPDYAPAVPAKPDPASVIPWGLRVGAETGWRLLVLAGLVWVLMQVVRSVSLVIIAFAAGLLVTALLQPTVTRLRRLGLGRGLATFITLILGLGFLGLIGWFVGWQITENTGVLTGRVQDGIQELQRWLVEGPLHVPSEQINDIGGQVTDWLDENSQELTSYGLEGVTVLLEFFSGVLLALFTCLFLLYDGSHIWRWVLRFFPANARPGVAAAGPRAWRTLTGYVRGTVIVALIDAIGIGLGLWLLDVPLAVPLAVLVFLGAFVPIVGAVLSGALAVIVAIVTNGPFTALLALGVVLLVQQIESHILQPFILGRLVRVHPLAVVLAVACGSLVAGIPGAVVAVPLVAVTNTIVVSLRAYAHEQTMARATAASGPSPSSPSSPAASPAPASKDRKPAAPGDTGGKASGEPAPGRPGDAAPPKAP